MDLPKYIKIGVSYMQLSTEFQEYTTYGWELPVRCVKKDGDKLIITNFMKHLNGKQLTPIIEQEYLRNT